VPSWERFLTERDRPDWDDGEPARGSVTGRIDRFRPENVPPDAWARIEELVRRCVAAAAGASPAGAGGLLSTFTQFVLWADRNGTPLTDERLLGPDLIEEFTRSPNTHLKRGTRQNYRSDLRRIGSAVLGPPLYPQRVPAIRESDPDQPYTPAEVDAFYGKAVGQRTERLRTNLVVLLALGAGGGLTSRELLSVTGGDVHCGDGLVCIDVPGNRARRVALLARWAPIVAERAGEVGPRPMFRPERSGPARHDISKVVSQAKLDGLPLLTSQRLRITWIVHHLASGTPLADAAGVTAPSLAKYALWVPPLDPTESRVLLRDATPC
jgi:integrase